MYRIVVWFQVLVFYEVILCVWFLGIACGSFFPCNFVAISSDVVCYGLVFSLQNGIVFI